MAATIFFSQDLLVEQVLDADAEAGRLVGVAGPDAAAGRADLELAEPRLARGSSSRWYGMITWALALTRSAGDVDAARAQAVELA